jgi:predicted AlkP superfamily pyrophosphatase or phosphodiesterase
MGAGIAPVLQDDSSVEQPVQSTTQALMHRFRPRALVALGSTVLVLFLSGAGEHPAPVRQGAVSDHVIVISLDGMRPDALMKYGGSTIERLTQEGTYTIEAQTIFPSKTLPSHTSMLTGVPPEQHGITWNSDETDEVGEVKVPTVFEVAHAAGYTTAAFFSKSKFHHLQKPGTLDYTQAPEGGDKWMATRTVGDVINYLHHERPNLLFVHIAETDYAGHSLGWMSFAYKWAVKRADAAVAAVMKAADDAFGKGNYTMIVTADHGGHDRNHGSIEPVDNERKRSEQPGDAHRPNGQRRPNFTPIHEHVQSQFSS